MSYKNSHPNTYNYMRSGVLMGIKDVDTFGLSQRQEILLGLFEEIDTDWKHALLNDSSIDLLCGSYMIKFGYFPLSALELQEIRLHHVARYWGNVIHLLENIFDEAEIEIYKENGGISEHKEHLSVDNSERCNDMNEVLRRAS